MSNPNPASTAAAVPVPAPVGLAAAPAQTAAPAVAPAPIPAPGLVTPGLPTAALAPSSGIPGEILHQAAGVNVHQHAPLVHSEEKKEVSHHADHEVHRPSKPAIHPGPPMTKTSTVAATGPTPGAAPSSASAGAIAAPKHHYAVHESLNGSLWTLTTSKSWKSVCEELPLQATAHKFSVLGKHDLQEICSKKGIPFHYETMIFELCNAQMVSTLLAEHQALSAVLPCRLSVTAKFGKDGCALHMFLPTTLLSDCFEHEAAVDQSKKPFKFLELAENITWTLKEIIKMAATK
jgi:uncharacterized protein (DUF302 family)